MITGEVEREQRQRQDPLIAVRFLLRHITLTRKMAQGTIAMLQVKRARRVRVDQVGVAQGQLLIADQINRRNLPSSGQLDRPGR
jgi:hypothetical protein